MKEKVTFFLLKEKGVKHSQLKRTLLITILFLAVFFLSRNNSLSQSKIKPADSNNKAGEAKGLLVKFKDDQQIYVFKFADSADLKAIANDYQKNPAIEIAEPNYLYQSAILPSDTYYNNQWYLKKIKAQSAWDIARESPNIIIAVIDSGVQINHPDLQDNIWKNKGEIPNNGIDDDNNGFIDDVNGWDFVNNVNDPEPKFNKGYTANGILHGTIVAGIAAAAGNNAAGVCGITWRVQIMPLKALDDSGEGETNNVIRAIDYAIANKADIINLSFVGANYSRALEMAIKRAFEAGIIIVAAAGNDEGKGVGFSLDKTPMYPVCYDGDRGENMVIGVAATDALDQKATFSGYGSKCIDISAPGISIFSTAVYSPSHAYNNLLFDKYYDGYWSGTSMAVPIISGTLALIENLNPSLTRNEVIKILLQSSDNIDHLNQNYISKLGSGRVNVNRALILAREKLTNHTASLLVTPAVSNGKIATVNEEGKVIKEFLAYPANFRNGVNLVVDDVDNDNRNEIITAPGAGSSPQVKIFNQDGIIKSQFLAYPTNFRNGVNLAVGDVDSDGFKEIVVAPAGGYLPNIIIFDYKGKMKSQFFAYNKNFRGGVNLAVGDVDGDSRNEIITAPSSGGGPQVKVFTFDGKMKSQFFAYNKNFHGGVNLSVGDVDGGIRGKKLEIITAPGTGGGPQVKIFTFDGKMKSQFFAYDKKFHGGVNLAMGDIDYDGLDEILTGAGQGGAPHVRVFEKDGVLLYSFYAPFSAKDFNSGVKVGVITY